MDPNKNKKGNGLPPIFFQSPAIGSLANLVDDKYIDPEALTDEQYHDLALRIESRRIRQIPVLIWAYANKPNANGVRPAPAEIRRLAQSSPEAHFLEGHREEPIFGRVNFGKVKKRDDKLQWLQNELSIRSPEAMLAFLEGRYRQFSIRPSYERASCSLCREDVRLGYWEAEFTCNHQFGHHYNNRLCEIFLHDCSLMEVSAVTWGAVEGTGTALSNSAYSIGSDGERKPLEIRYSRASKIYTGARLKSKESAMAFVYRNDDGDRWDVRRGDPEFEVLSTHDSEDEAQMEVDRLHDENDPRPEAQNAAARRRYEQWLEAQRDGNSASLNDAELSDSETALEVEIEEDVAAGVALEDKSSTSQSVNVNVTIPVAEPSPTALAAAQEPQQKSLFEDQPTVDPTQLTELTRQRDEAVTAQLRAEMQVSDLSAQLKAVVAERDNAVAKLASANVEVESMVRAAYASLYDVAVTEERVLPADRGLFDDIFDATLSAKGPQAALSKVKERLAERAPKSVLPSSETLGETVPVNDEDALSRERSAESLASYNRWLNEYTKKVQGERISLEFANAELKRLAKEYGVPFSPIPPRAQ